MRTNCACCNREFDDSEERFDWEERHVNIVKSEHTGYSRRDTYRYSDYSDEVCEKCYRKLKRNAIIIPLVYWLLLFAIPIGSYYFCGTRPALQRSLYFVPLFMFTLFLIDSDLGYSIIGFLLRPFCGYYRLHPLGQLLSIQDEKENNRIKRNEKKEERIKKVLIKKYKISSIDASNVVLFSELDDLIDNKKYRHLSPKKLAQIIVPDKVALHSLLEKSKRTASIALDDPLAKEFDDWVHSLPIEVLFGHSASEIIELFDKERGKRI